MSKSFYKFVLNALLVFAGTIVADGVSAQEVPELLQPPASEKMVLQVHAQGDQIYTCKTDTPVPTWTLKGPDAKLFSADGKSFGKHYAGPTWEANDGSKVVGKVGATVASPDADSAPWLLVKAVSHGGKGVLSRVTSIQRLNTKGGKIPASGCDEVAAGQDKRVPYEADYVFFAPK